MGKKRTIEIKEKVVFEVTYPKIAESIAYTLASAGYFVKIRKSKNGWIDVCIYTDRIDKV